MNVLVLHQYISKTGGSSISTRNYIKGNEGIKNYKILSTYTFDIDNTELRDNNIVVVKSFNDVYNILKREHFDIIHNFRSEGYGLFNWVIKACDKLNIKPKIITTINQQPNNRPTLISPSEIIHSDKIVFIDKTAYNNSLLNFIPMDKKEMIYFSTLVHEKFIKYYNLHIDSTRNNSIIKFGRGSSIDKCPDDMIENFNKIDIPNKEFHIYGIPSDSHVTKATVNYPNIFAYPLLPHDEWLLNLCKLDVYLYQIPENTYSSLDATLGTAMLFGIPVVYFGAAAPKERLINGVNGFVANTKEEFIKYATLLAKDKELRHKIGEAGRESTIKTFSLKNTVAAYNKLYEDNLSSEKTIVPLSYIIFFYMNYIYHHKIKKCMYLLKEKYITSKIKLYNLIHHKKSHV